MPNRAFQLEVTGALNGSTLWVPGPDPGPIGGQTRYLVPGPIGLIDLDSVLPTRAAIWLRAVHVEFSITTRAAEVLIDPPGSRQDQRIIRTLANTGGPPLMEPVVLSPNAMAPLGSRLRIRTDDTDQTFTGAPAAGPHFVYFELDGMDSDDELAAVLAMQGAASDRARSGQQSGSSFQAIAATATTDPLLVVQSPQTSDTDAINQVMRLGTATVSIGTAPAAGESMVISIIRVQPGGPTTTLASLTVDDTFSSDSITNMTVASAANILEVGDQVIVTRTYVAGGAPAPLDDTFVSFSIVPFTTRGPVE